MKIKHTFLVVALLLALASAATWYTLQERSAHPQIVWTAGLSPDRVEQVEAFHGWLRANGYVDKDGELLFTVRLETTDNQSALIQAVSGMAGDLIDHVPVKRFAPMGVLEEITGFARENGLDPAAGYGEAAGDLLMYGGKQYAYFCNLATRGLLLNLDLFEKYGVEPPPEEWTPADFERIGREFVRKANAGRPRQEVFFSGAMPQAILPLARSLGADVFNETLTAATLTDPAFVRALETYYGWVYRHHLIPTAAEATSTESEGTSVNSEATPQLAAGRYGMILTGRYVNMDLRRFRNGRFRLAFVQLPEWEYKNLVTTSRNTAIYKGSKHKEQARLFLKFLAAKEYNDLIIRSSDGLPPNPEWAEGNPEFRTPPGREFEGDLHDNELKWTLSIGIPESQSPYYPLGDNKLSYAFAKVESKLASPEEALKQAEEAINYSIRSTVEGTTSLQEEYRAACERQRQIDRRKAAGEKIPAGWIRNPFYRKFYRDRGMLADH